MTYTAALHKSELLLALHPVVGKNAPCPGNTWSDNNLHGEQREEEATTKGLRSPQQNM